MRILIFLPCFTDGGAEKQAAILAKHLQRSGHYTEAWGFPSLGKGTPLFESLTSAGIICRELHRWPYIGRIYNDDGSNAPKIIAHSVKRFLNKIKLSSRLPQGGFDIVIPFTVIPCWVSALCKKHIATHAYWNHRGGYDSGGFTYSQYVLKKVTENHLKFIANSEHGARFLSDRFFVPLDSVTIVKNAFTPDEEWEILPTLERHRSGSNRPLRLLHVSNIFRKKDIWTVLDATRILKAIGIDFELTIAGFFIDDNEELRFLSEIDRDLKDIVRYRGPVERKELEHLLVNADIGLLSSLCEGSSNSVLEYMYAGLPVIGTDIPGIRDILPEVGRKWLFRVGDTRTLASMIVDMASSEHLRLKLGSINRKHVESEFSVCASMAKWNSLLGIS